MSSPSNASGGSPTPATAAPLPKIRRRRSRTPAYLVAAVVLLAVVVGGAAYAEKWWGGAAPRGASACSTGTTLQGNGATFVNALALTWVAGFSGSTGNSVNWVDGGSGTGITDLTSKTVDFAATDDPLTPSQRAGLPGVLTLPVTGGALAIIYNVAGVPSGLHLSAAVLADIYLGKVTAWNDPAIGTNNSGITLPSSTILTVHRADAAGTTFVLSDYLSQGSAGWQGQVGKGISIPFPTSPHQVAIKGNAALLTEVQTTPNTIGYVDLTDLLASTTSTTYAAMQNPQGAFVLPNLTTTASAIADKSSQTVFPSSTGDWFNVSMVNAAGTADYPLATFAYFFVYQATDGGFSPSLVKAQILVQWLHWVLEAGQADSGPLNYVALSASVVSLDDQGIATMTYHGAPIPACD